MHLKMESFRSTRSRTAESGVLTNRPKSTKHPDSVSEFPLIIFCIHSNYRVNRKYICICVYVHLIHLNHRQRMKIDAGNAYSTWNIDSVIQYAPCLNTFLLFVITGVMFRGVARILFRWGNILGCRPRGGPGAGAPQMPENFRKFAKIFLRKLQKSIILAYFNQNFTKPALSFGAFGRKTQIVGTFLRKFWKFEMKMQLKNWLFNYFWKSWF